MIVATDRPGSRAAWIIAARLAWVGVGILLLWVLAVFAAYASAVVVYPFGLDYSEGLIWQQALWIPGPHMYGDISHYPYLVFEYPPLYHVAVRGLAAAGLDMLVAGRLLSLVCAIITAGLISFVVRDMCRGFGRGAAAMAGLVAGPLMFSFAPVITWSPLMRVDMLGMALTYGGIVLATQSFRRPALLYAALLCFVAACYTKQIFIAAPIAVLVVHFIRNPRLAARAGAFGLLLGLAALAWLTWLTAGGFLRHILLYNIHRFSLRGAIDLSFVWITAYPIFAALVVVSVTLCWWRKHGADIRALIRDDDTTAKCVLMTAYLVLCTATLIFAGKSGSSINYFIEFECAWCVWIGWLAGFALSTAADHPRLAPCLPLLLAAQVASIPHDIHLLRSLQLSPTRTRDAKALLDRVRQIPGKLLSDDGVLNLRTNREVGLEPAILAELAANGTWDENKLIAMLHNHEFGAVITAYGPGVPTFDARYLPRTQAAMLADYPRVENYGDYRLRLP